MFGKNFLKHVVATAMVVLPTVYLQQEHSGESKKDALHFAIAASVTLAAIDGMLALVKSLRERIEESTLQKYATDVVQTIAAMFFICGVFQAADACFGAYDETGVKGADHDFNNFMRVLGVALSMRLFMQWTVNCLKSKPPVQDLRLSGAPLLMHSDDVYGPLSESDASHQQAIVTLGAERCNPVWDLLPPAAEVGFILCMGVVIGIELATRGFATGVAAVALKNAVLSVVSTFYRAWQWSRDMAEVSLSRSVPSEGSWGGSARGGDNGDTAAGLVTPVRYAARSVGSRRYSDFEADTRSADRDGDSHSLVM
jgi:hypothetical protein